MSGNKGLLDSNVIIDISKGNLSTESIIKDYDYLYTSIISYVETLGYQFTDEEEKELVLEVLKQVEIVDLNKTIADIAIQYRQRRKIKLPDALVLATAKYLDADLLTSDVADFKNVDSSVRLVTPRKL
jgi:predicted nucleic acid-binding protein